MWFYWSVVCVCVCAVEESVGGSWAEEVEAQGACLTIWGGEGSLGRDGFGARGRSGSSCYPE